MDDNTRRDNIIKSLFDIGLKQRDIAMSLKYLGFSLSERQVRRILRQLQLQRRGNYSDSVTVTNFIQNQLEASGKLHGYRWMHEKCIVNGLRVRREDVRTILSIMDREGCIFRKRRRLYRRRYSTPGPHFIWHVDGYDKIKPYGFGISGCIDGFSRNLIWLNVYITNNDPRIIAGYFVQAMSLYSGAPKIIRTDDGTENVRLKEIQESITTPEGQNLLYISGSSHSNQRIECFWAHLRKQCMEYWICIFHKLQDTGYFCGDVIDKNLLQFCFLAIIQNELDEILQTWNRHQIRASRRGLPSVRPIVMMETPFLYGTQSYLRDMDQSKSNNLIIYASRRKPYQSTITCLNSVAFKCERMD